MKEFVDKKRAAAKDEPQKEEPEEEEEEEIEEDQMLHSIVGSVSVCCT